MSTAGKKLTLYYLFALLITWSIWLPLVSNRQFETGLAVLPYQHYAGSFGPLLAALIVTLVFEGPGGVLRFIKSCFRKTGRPLSYVAVIVVPVVCFAIAVEINYRFTGLWPEWRDIGITRQLPGFSTLSAWLFWIFTFGVGEETGWRGFALQELQQVMKPVKASLCLGVMWAIWHVPAFFYDQEYLAMGGAALAGWLLAILYGSVFLSWLCNIAGGSILLVALWHGTFDMLIACDAATGVIPGVMSMLVIVMAIVIMKSTKGLLGYSAG